MTRLFARLIRGGIITRNLHRGAPSAEPRVILVLKASIFSDTVATTIMNKDSYLVEARLMILVQIAAGLSPHSPLRVHHLHRATVTLPALG